MPAAIVTDFPGGSQDRYDAMMTDLDLEQHPAIGLIVHAAGPIDVWASEQDADRFVQDRLLPALQRAGASGQPQITVTPLHNFVH